MAKKESSLVNMVLTLFLVTAVSATVLGYIYEITKEPIAKAKAEKKNRAIKAVVPTFDNDPGAEMKEVPVDGDVLRLYTARQGNEVVGTAVETFTKKGFSGKFKIMVGFTPEGVIHNIAVLEHKETPGLGDKMEKKKSDWSLQFNGKDPAKVKILVTKDGGPFDAITATTISSRAFCDAVQRAYDTYMQTKGGE